MDIVLRDGIVVGLANHTALIGKDGTERSIEDSAAPVRDATGTISGAVMVLHDVTQRRRGGKGSEGSRPEKGSFPGDLGARAS